MKKKDIAKALGSSKTVPLKTKKLDGPLTYLNLIKEVNTRIVSKIGRPSDKKKTKYHNIPLTDKTWKQLKKKAKIIPAKRKPSASQLASFLIEEGLRKLDEEIKEYDLGKIGG